jgi:anti-sigma regulatory factor (Ser/Thr protein kinase)
MQLELLLSNERRVLPGVRALARETLAQLPMPAADARELASLVVGAVENAVEHAYREGEEGSIKLSIVERHGKLEITVRDYGIPQDVELMEHQLHASGAAPATLFGCHAAGLVDEAHWLAYGPAGKALQIRKWLHVTSVADHPDARALEPFRDDAPLAPEQEYVVRRMLSEEALEVSQLMYRAYGNTYFNPDVYYPERIAAQNANGSVISFVVKAADGSIAGHSALERNQPGPVAEKTGQAVVDPAHRGRGLLNRLKDVALDEARGLDLTGWFADAVAVHTLTQKSNRDHGGHLTCVDLGISPKSEVFRGIAAEQPQRVTCLSYFHWLKPPEERTIHVPARYREIISAIYENLQCPARFADATAPAGHGTLAIMLDSAAGKASVRAEQLGADTVRDVRHALRELVERSRAQVVFVDLPLADSATPQVAEALEGLGFAFAGVAPHFSTRGDLLRLAYLVEPLAREPIKTLEGFESRLVDYALTEQNRVRKSL